MQETWVLSLGREYPLEKGMAIHSSILAWRIPHKYFFEIMAHQTKELLLNRGSLNKMKRQLVKWKKILANHIGGTSGKKFICQ